MKCEQFLDESRRVSLKELFWLLYLYLFRCSDLGEFLFCVWFLIVRFGLFCVFPRLGFGLFALGLVCLLWGFCVLGVLFLCGCFVCWDFFFGFCLGFSLSFGLFFFTLAKVILYHWKAASLHLSAITRSVFRMVSFKPFVVSKDHICPNHLLLHMLARKFMLS